MVTRTRVALIACRIHAARSNLAYATSGYAQPTGHLSSRSVSTSVGAGRVVSFRVIQAPKALKGIMFPAQSLEQALKAVNALAPMGMQPRFAVACMLAQRFARQPADVEKILSEVPLQNQNAKPEVYAEAAKRAFISLIPRTEILTDQLAPRLSPADAEAALILVDAAVKASVTLATNNATPGTLMFLLTNPAIANRRESIKAIVEASNNHKWKKRFGPMILADSRDEAYRCMPKDIELTGRVTPSLRTASTIVLAHNTQAEPFASPDMFGRFFLDHTTSSVIRRHLIHKNLSFAFEQIRLALSPAARALLTTPETEAQYIEDLRSDILKLANEADARFQLQKSDKDTGKAYLPQLIRLYLLAGRLEQAEALKRTLQEHFPDSSFADAVEEQ
ncbi:hypothetical protein BKA62DRAFT_171670 [Auriculariales sp. MPI-PUGE-AT-0066]|nr:hypothetical protein BKA62DRAFT_171670 [Auriculariales sp. MPI-PUGE-AT-0066]